MKGTRIVVSGDLAHFKSSLNAAYQTSYKIPPISTVIGILKNFYGDNINHIRFGYRFEYDESNFHICIHKKVNAKFKMDKNNTSRTNNQLEYLENPKLIIYVLDEGLKINFNEVLNLGKTDCIAYAEFQEVEIVNKNAYANNIFTEMMEGEGVISKITSETEYTSDGGKYMQYYKMVRLNEEFECDFSCGDEGVYLWEYDNELEERVKCYRG